MIEEISALVVVHSTKKLVSKSEKHSLMYKAREKSSRELTLEHSAEALRIYAGLILDTQINLSDKNAPKTNTDLQRAKDVLTVGNLFSCLSIIFNISKYIQLNVILVFMML